MEYQRPDGFPGRRVLVVGAGNSAGEIGAELAGAGAAVTVCVRSGATVVPRELLGLPIQYVALALYPLPRAVQRLIAGVTARVADARRGPSPLPRSSRRDGCPDIPMIGFHLSDAIRAGRARVKPGLASLTDSGARFLDGTEEDFDDVLLATGYRAAVGPLCDLARLDHCGFARRVDRVRSADDPRLFFVGHNYDMRGGLYNIAIDSKLAAAGVASALQDA